MKLKQKLPDFLIIGSGKSGTTSLNNYLKQHPEIFIPDKKEPNFFGYELYSEKDFEGLPILTHYRNSVTDLESYLNLFTAAEESQKIGETSNTYMYHEKAPERIHYYIPDVKLIAVLRQPVERLYSRYLHLARENRLPTEKFQDCLDRQSIWWKRNDLVNEGFYYKHLSKFYKIFGKTKIRIFLYEEFISDAMKMLQEIFHFIDVDENFKPDISINYNKSGFIRNRMYNSLLGQDGFVKKVLETATPSTIYQKLKKNLFIQRQLNRVRSKNLLKPKLSADIKNEITNDIYREDIINLEKLIGRDLGHWRTS